MPVGCVYIPNMEYYISAWALRCSFFRLGQCEGLRWQNERQIRTRAFIMPESAKKIAFKYIKGYVVYETMEVLCFEYENRTWHLITITGNKIQLLNKTKSEILLSLSPYFCQITQNTIVNTNYIREISKTYNCTLICGSLKKSYLISRSYRNNVIDRLTIG